jgi:hypothetical protein
MIGFAILRAPSRISFPSPEIGGLEVQGGFPLWGNLSGI